MHEHITSAVHNAEGTYSPSEIARNYYLTIPISIGAIYFDITYPGWDAKVNLDLLDMGTGRLSVLAAVTGVDEDQTSEYREWTTSELRAHGFDPVGGSGLCYADLTVAWRKFIIDRIRRAQS